jgi:hypothetical protein
MSDDPTDDRLRQLNDATALARELLADVRSATKDLQHAIKAAQQERERLAATVDEAIAADINAAVQRELEEVSRVVNEKREWMLRQVTREFDRYINLLTTGREDGKTDPGRNLRLALPPIPRFQPPASHKQSTPDGT